MLRRMQSQNTIEAEISHDIDDNTEKKKYKTNIKVKSTQKNQIKTKIPFLQRSLNHIPYYQEVLHHDHKLSTHRKWKY